MYKHFLAPLDGTALSAASVAGTVELARFMGARITFFHTVPDWPATQGSAPQDPGTSNLTKAEAAAKAAGVPCEAIARRGDHSGEAIVQVAQEQGCDLIVMASHGEPPAHWIGWPQQSQAERVLRSSPVALLVTQVNAEQPLTSRERALSIISAEHRSIAVVVSAMREIAAALPASPHVTEDSAALRAMAGYMRRFPEKIHHPKEEKHLHRLLRARHAPSDALLQQVEAQHKREHELLDRVFACFDESRSDDRLRALPEAVQQFMDHVNAHLRLEETQVLPLAREHLDDNDWSEVFDAFMDNDDSRLGDMSGPQLRRLFTQIANGMAVRDAPGGT